MRSESKPLPAASERPVALVAAFALASALPPMNSVVLFVALVPIRDDFGISTATVAWLVTGYLIASAAMQPVGGRLGDLFGRQYANAYQWRGVAYRNLGRHEEAARDFAKAKELGYDPSDD